LWGFASKTLSILWSPILRDLGEVIKIYKADCGIKVAKAVLRLYWNCAEIVWDYSIVLSVVLGRNYAGKTETVDWEK
jgi:hypothetical protein